MTAVCTPPENGAVALARRVLEALAWRRSALSRRTARSRWHAASSRPSH